MNSPGKNNTTDFWRAPASQSEPFLHKKNYVRMVLIGSLLQQCCVTFDFHFQRQPCGQNTYNDYFTLHFSAQYEDRLFVPIIN